MKKSQVILVLGITLALGLTGCGSNKANHQSKDKAALNAKMANDQSANTDSSSASSGLNRYNYHVPKKETQSKNYVKNGKLTKPHQFSYDRFGTKQQLAQPSISHVSAVVGQHNITYQILNVKVLKNSAKTAAAKQAVAQVLNLPNVPDTYYTFVINYKVTNQRPVKIALNGVTSVKTNQGQTLQTSNQLTDSAAGQQIAAGQSRKFVMNGYLYHYADNPTTELSIAFGPAFNTKGKQIANAPDQLLHVKLS